MDRLSELHSCHYLHCDIKPDSVLLGSDKRNKEESSHIILIDFSLSVRWCDDAKKHVEPADKQPFKGNILFASHNAFKFQRLSRRDDLISLAYLTVFLVQGELTWFKGQKTDHPKFFENVSEIKLQMTPKGLCVGKAKALEPMVKEIFEYKFDEAPNYSKLKHLLACFLL